MLVISKQASSATSGVPQSQDCGCVLERHQGTLGRVQGTDINMCMTRRFMGVCTRVEH
jgi:hypothetical protein